MQCPQCHHIMTQRHEDKQFFYFSCQQYTFFAAGIQCKFCNLTKQSKKGCIKNIKYIMLKHYKQEHQHWYKPSLSLQCNINNNITNYIVSHNPVHNIVNTTDSISNISLSSNSKQTNSVAFSSSNDNTPAINFLFYQFNYFDSQPNELYFFLIMLHPQHGGAHGIVWRALNSINKCTYNVGAVEDTQFVKSCNLIPRYSSKH